MIFSTGEDGQIYTVTDKMPAGWRVEGGKIGNPGDVKVAQVSESDSLDVGRSPRRTWDWIRAAEHSGGLDCDCQSRGTGASRGGVLPVRGGAGGLQVWGAGQGPRALPDLIVPACPFSASRNVSWSP